MHSGGPDNSAVTSKNIFLFSNGNIQYPEHANSVLLTSESQEKRVSESGIPEQMPDSEKCLCFWLRRYRLSRQTKNKEKEV